MPIELSGEVAKLTLPGTLRAQMTERDPVTDDLVYRTACRGNNSVKQDHVTE